MTNEEIICTWAQGFDPRTQAATVDIDGLRWWVARFRASRWEFAARLLTLDALHEVEERLSDEQWRNYEELLLGGSLEESTHIPPPRYHFDCDMEAMKVMIHATAEQKIAAIAFVLKGEVKP